MLSTARSLVFWLLLPFVAVQALRLRRTAPRLQAATGEARGRTGSGPSMRLLAIGDSIIAGVGASTLDRALVGRTAESLAKLRGRTVEWEAHGLSGANARRILADLVPVLDPLPADAMIVSVGVNDVTSLSSIRAWKRNLLALVAALRAHSPNAVIVVAGIPPLRVFPLIPEPLRSLIGFRGETLDRVMGELLQEHAGVLHTPVVFDIRSDSFCADGFHPSERSYIEFGEAMAARIATQLAE
jgi:lysophospholipase L1-like esterase